MLYGRLFKISAEKDILRFLIDKKGTTENAGGGQNMYGSLIYDEDGILVHRGKGGVV